MNLGWRSNKFYHQEMQRGNYMMGYDINSKYLPQKKSSYNWKMTKQQRQDYERASVAQNVMECLYYYCYKKFYMGGGL